MFLGEYIWEQNIFENIEIFILESMIILNISIFIL